jgi:hypothetical protein
MSRCSRTALSERQKVSYDRYAITPLMPREMPLRFQTFILVRA